MDAKFPVISQMLTTINTSLNSLQQETGIPARTLAATTSVRMKIDPCSDLNNCDASEILVHFSLNGTYVATNRHVPSSNEKNCWRNVMEVMLLFGQYLSQFSAPLFSSDDSIDLALIPVDAILEVEGVQVIEQKFRLV
jgi:hypothetical protein